MGMKEYTAVKVPPGAFTHFLRYLPAYWRSPGQTMPLIIEDEKAEDFTWWLLSGYVLSLAALITAVSYPLWPGAVLGMVSPAVLGAAWVFVGAWRLEKASARLLPHSPASGAHLRAVLAWSLSPALIGGAVATLTLIVLHASAHAQGLKPDGLLGDNTVLSWLLFPGLACLGLLLIGWGCASLVVAVAAVTERRVLDAASYMLETFARDCGKVLFYVFLCALDNALDD